MSEEQIWVYAHAKRLDTCDAAIMTAKDKRRGCGTEGQATTSLVHEAISTTWEYYYYHRNYARKIGSLQRIFS